MDGYATDHSHRCPRLNISIAYIWKLRPCQIEQRLCKPRNKETYLRSGVVPVVCAASPFSRFGECFLPPFCLSEHLGCLDSGRFTHIRICSSSQQSFDDGFFVLENRSRYWRLPSVVQSTVKKSQWSSSALFLSTRESRAFRDGKFDSLRICTVFQQQLDSFYMSMVSCQHDQSISIRVREIWRESSFERSLEDVDSTGTSCIKELMCRIVDESNVECGVRQAQG